MNRNKFFSILSKIGAFFIIFLVVSYFTMDKTPKKDVIVVNEAKIQTNLTKKTPEDLNPPPVSRVKERKKYKKMKESSFMAPEGRYKRWRDFEGNYLLVNFWATWCPPCVVELPSMTKLQKAFKDKGLDVIAISMDQNISQDELKEFTRRRGIGTFANYMDTRGDIQRNIKMRGLPTTYLLNPKGEVIHIFEGDSDWFSPISTDFFTKLLAQKAGTSTP